MSWVILHGDSQVASRQALNERIRQVKAGGVKDVVRFDGKTVSLSEVMQAMEARSLFGTSRLVVIEELFSRQQSKEKEAIFDYIKSLAPEKTAAELFLWERKKVDGRSLVAFRVFLIQEFKTAAIVFKFLESVRPGNAKAMLELAHRAMRQESAVMVFYMLARQVRLLLEVGEKGLVKLADWQISRLKRQRELIGEEKLLELHEQLVLIDERVKTGESALGLEGEIDMWLFSI